MAQESVRKKDGGLQRLFSTFFKLKATISCWVESSDSEAVNLGNRFGMRVACTLHFPGQSDFIDILNNKLCKHNWWYSYHA